MDAFVEELRYLIRVKARSSYIEFSDDIEENKYIDSELERFAKALFVLVNEDKYG